MYNTVCDIGYLIRTREVGKRYTIHYTGTRSTLLLIATVTDTVPAKVVIVIMYCKVSIYQCYY